MAYVITDLCKGIKDTGCVTICPVDAIHPKPGTPEFETAEQLYIHPVDCICCGLCVDECPVRAIFPKEDLPRELSHFAQINADWFERRV